MTLLILGIKLIFYLVSFKVQFQNTKGPMNSRNEWVHSLRAGKKIDAPFTKQKACYTLLPSFYLMEIVLRQ